MAKLVPWRSILLPTVLVGLLVGGVFLCCVSGGDAGASVRCGLSGGARKRESTPRSWNKVLRASLFFVVVRSGVAVGSVSWCTGAWLFFFGAAFGVVSPGFGVVLLLWCSVTEVRGGRRAESEEPTADTLFPRISCGFPMFGVRSLILKGKDGGVNIRCLSPELGRRWRKLVLRRTTNSASGGSTVQGRGAGRPRPRVKRRTQRSGRVTCLPGVGGLPRVMRASAACRVTKQPDSPVLKETAAAIADIRFGGYAINSAFYYYAKITRISIL